MSLLPFVDPFGWYPIDFYGRRRYRWNPFRELERMDRELERIRREMDIIVGDLDRQLPWDRTNELGGRLEYNERGDLALRCHTSGFKPEELRVDLDGDRLTVSGRHEEEKDGRRVERYFTRVIPLGKEFDQAKIKCELDDNGELCVQVPRHEAIEGPKQTSVPIEMKKGNAAVEHKTNEQSAVEASA